MFLDATQVWWMKWYNILATGLVYILDLARWDMKDDLNFFTWSQIPQWNPWPHESHHPRAPEALPGRWEALPAGAKTNTCSHISSNSMEELENGFNNCLQHSSQTPGPVHILDLGGFIDIKEDLTFFTLLQIPQRNPRPHEGHHPRAPEALPGRWETLPGRALRQVHRGVEGGVQGRHDVSLQHHLLPLTGPEQEQAGRGAHCKCGFVFFKGEDQ